MSKRELPNTRFAKKRHPPRRMLTRGDALKTDPRLLVLARQVSIKLCVALAFAEVRYPSGMRDFSLLPGISCRSAIGLTMAESQSYLR